MTTDRLALLAAILAHPDEDTPRLAFADLLDEEGEHRWAARIRAEIETHRAEGRDDWAGLLIPYLNDWWYELDRRKPARPAERCLMDPPGDRGDARAFGLVSRGFVGGVRCDFVSFRRYAAEWFRTRPIQHVLLFDKQPLVAGPPQRFAWVTDVDNDLASGEVLPREWVRDMGRWGVGQSVSGSTGRWFGTVEAACAALSEHCVALGRQAALTGDPP